MKYRELYDRRHELLFKKDYARAPRYAKWVTHRITPILVYGAGRLGLTPDQVTAASLLIGWTAAFCLAQDGLGRIAVGALLTEAYYVLDSVDGQLARWKKIFSKSGAFLDVMGNYLVHPWIFVGLGIGLARMGLGWAPVALGASAAFGYFWMGALWEVRSNVLFSALRREGAVLKGGTAPGAAASGPRSAAGRGFAMLHKLCTYPTAMNLLTLSSVAAWVFGDPAPLAWYLTFYAAAIPAVAMAKIAKMFLSKEIDTEYTALRS